MVERKNQHYVPKHLLRGWTDDERVPVYNIVNRREYPRTSISNLCSEDYFYGGPEVEESMDGIEERHAQIINKLRESKSFKALGDMDICHFCAFILLQRNRTKQQKQETEDMIDSLAKEHIQLKVESGEVDPELPDGRNALDLLDDFRVTHENPLALPMLQALTGIDLIIDLEVVVIENRSEKSFIISDHPVVHDNRRFKDEIDRFLVGLQNRGIQIFVPISDKVQIMLYDPASYFVEYSDEEARKVITTSEKVITGLNDMQMISASESIFYREEGQEEEFQNAQERLSEYIEEDKTIFQSSSPEEHDLDTENEIIEFGQNLPNYSPYLPFVKLRIEAEFAIERRPGVVHQQSKFVNELLEDARREYNESD